MINQSSQSIKRLAVILLTSFFSSQIYAVDVVKLQLQQKSNNKAAHNFAVIHRALEITEKEYGPYKIEKVDITMSSARMLQSLTEGQLINTAIVPASDLWDKHTLSVKVPVRLGLLSYRLLLINKSDLTKFKNINSLEELKQFSAGLHKGWVTTKLFNLYNFKVMETGHFEGLFLMLNRNRFDYIPRAVYEIYDEIASRQDMLTDIIVEPTIALNIPTFSYVNVAPSSPQIAKRLQDGLVKMLSNGELKSLLYQYYGKDIKKADLNNRKIFKINNPDFKTESALHYENLLTATN